MAHNYAFENFVQKDFDFLKEPLDHNIDNNNIETEIDMNIDENQRVSDNRDITTLNEDQLNNDNLLRRSTRSKRIPSFLKDYHPQVNNSSFKEYFSTIYPITSVLSYKSLSDKYLKYIIAISSSTESHNFDEAYKNPNQTEAM